MKKKSQSQKRLCWKREVKSSKKKNEGTGLTIKIPNKLLTRLPVLLSQISAGNNSYKVKNEIRQILYLLYHYNKTTKKLYNNYYNNGGKPSL